MNAVAHRPARSQDLAGLRFRSQGRVAGGVSEVEFLGCPADADCCGTLLYFLDGGAIGSEVELKVEELEVAAGIRVDGVEDGLKEVSETPAGIGVGKAAVGDIELVSPVFGAMSLGVGRLSWVGSGRGLLTG
jgi:hypothetical protein